MKSWFWLHGVVIILKFKAQSSNIDVTVFKLWMLSCTRACDIVPDIEMHKRQAMHCKTRVSKSYHDNVTPWCRPNSTPWQDRFCIVIFFVCTVDTYWYLLYVFIIKKLYNAKKHESNNNDLLRSPSHYRHRSIFPLMWTITDCKLLAITGYLTQYPCLV